MKETEQEVYDGVMKTIKWKRIKVPIKKDPYGDDKW